MALLYSTSVAKILSELGNNFVAHKQFCSFNCFYEFFASPKPYMDYDSWETIL